MEEVYIVIVHNIDFSDKGWVTVGSYTTKEKALDVMRIIEEHNSAYKPSLEIHRLNDFHVINDLDEYFYGIENWNPNRIYQYGGLK